jgi:hypothetical protein
MDRAEQDFKKRIMELDDRARRLKAVSEERARSLDGHEAGLRADEKRLARNDARVKKREAWCESIESQLGAEKQKTRVARTELREARAELEESERTVVSLTRKIGNQERKLSRIAAQAGSPIMVTNPEVRSWLIEDFDPAILGELRYAVTVGSGPFPADDFDALVRSAGYEVYPAGDSEIDIMIVGREAWTEQELEEQIAAREGETLRVYSQEMFLAAMATSRDPFDADREVLMMFGKGHPALEYLMKSEINWPDFEGDGEPLEWTFEETAEESPLHKMGYVVGITNGLPEHQRREILTRAFNGALPWAGSDEYMAGWGQPRTRRRLWRMAHHIGWLAKTRQGMPSMYHAVGDWESDRRWLRREFYTARMRFEWPEVEV